MWGTFRPPLGLMAHKRVRGSDEIPMLEILYVDGDSLKKSKRVESCERRCESGRRSGGRGHYGGVDTDTARARGGRRRDARTTLRSGYMVHGFVLPK